MCALRALKLREFGVSGIRSGQDAWTMLTQIAADALEAPVEGVQVEIGDSALLQAFPAWGSSTPCRTRGTASAAS